MSHLTVALDYDGTLVDKTQHWLPGAEQALRAILTRGHRVIIHSSRANSETGVKQIEARLGPLAQRVMIKPKPEADVYLDNKAVRFTNWSDALTHLRHLAR